MKGPDGFELVTRRLCLIKDTGHAGILWGGTMMGWVDEAVGVYAGLLTQNANMVTKAFTDIDFKRQVRPGDFVEFWGKATRWGTTSLSLRIRVFAGRPTSPERWEVLDVTAVCVAVNEQGEKAPVIRAKNART